MSLQLLSGQGQGSSRGGPAWGKAQDHHHPLSDLTGRMITFPGRKYGALRGQKSVIPFQWKWMIKEWHWDTTQQMGKKTVQYRWKWCGNCGIVHRFLSEYVVGLSDLICEIIAHRSLQQLSGFKMFLGDHRCCLEIHKPWFYTFFSSKLCPQSSYWNQWHLKLLNVDWIMSIVIKCGSLSSTLGYSLEMSGHLLEYHSIASLDLCLMIITSK